MKTTSTTSLAIIFDLGGVLMDWNPYYLYCDQMGMDKEAVDWFLKEVDFHGWNKEQDRGRTFAEATAELSARFPTYKDLIYAYDEHYLHSVGGSIQPVVEILGWLSDAGYPLFALSNWPAEKFALVKPMYPFFDLFDDMVISGEVGMVKPDADIFLLTLERVGRKAESCLYIDDHLPNIQAADALGFQTIHFQSPQQLLEALKDRHILN